MNPSIINSKDDRVLGIMLPDEVEERNKVPSFGGITDENDVIAI